MSDSRAFRPITDPVAVSPFHAPASLLAAGVVIQQVSQTREGGVILKLKEATKGAVAAFSEHLKAKNIGADIRHLKRDATVAIRGLDGSVDITEVKIALHEGGVPADVMPEVTLGELRDGFTGRRTAIVRLPAGHAQALLRKGSLIVGWSKCHARVTEYEQSICCYKCQQFGHLSWQCKETETTAKRCYRCGSTEHLAKDCSAELAERFSMIGSVALTRVFV
ncbi:MAG: hypothetical protein EOP84_04975 [Verrucomicrobiaceae bacterium]|nr:MAG: hypothetical protein EOP84_04975 [Verrucomicrobiaceae bacterium]